MLRKIHLNYGIIASPRFCYRSHFQKAESSEDKVVDGNILDPQIEKWFRTFISSDDFRVLDLKRTQKNDQLKRKRMRQMDVPPPRFQQMRVDQDWGAVWPGPRTYQPSTVPLAALRQGWVRPNRAPPGKFANAELLKIPNFLHLTPPVIKKQCETLKKFCTAFPDGLETEEKQEKHFPIRVTTADYVTGLPTIRYNCMTSLNNESSAHFIQNVYLPTGIHYHELSQFHWSSTDWLSTNMRGTSSSGWLATDTTLKLKSSR